MALKRCLQPGCPTLTPRTRCPTHERVQQRAKDAKRPQRRTHQAITTNAQLVQAWVDEHGWWCPGLADGPGAHANHPSTDLVADHVVPVAAGGAEDGAKRVICRPGNSARTANLRRLRPGRMK